VGGLTCANGGDHIDIVSFFQQQINKTK